MGNIRPGCGFAPSAENERTGSDQSRKQGRAGASCGGRRRSRRGKRRRRGAVIGGGGGTGEQEPSELWAGAPRAAAVRGCEQASSIDGGTSSRPRAATGAAASCSGERARRRTRSSSIGGPRAAAAAAAYGRKIRAALCAGKKTRGGEKESDALGPRVSELNPPQLCHLLIAMNRTALIVIGIWTYTILHYQLGNYK